MIIGVPTEWRVTPTIDGAVIDTPAGRVVYVARAPVMRARELVAQRLADRPGFTLTSIERAITDEGEFAVIATASSPSTHALSNASSPSTTFSPSTHALSNALSPSTHVLSNALSPSTHAPSLSIATASEIAWGIVYADESLAFYELETSRREATDAATATDAAIEGAPRAASAREIVALAARAHRFALGPRWRRYHYAIPAGWDAIARGLVTDWYAPGHPRAWGVLTAYPAFPASGLAIGIVPSLVANAKAQGLVIASEEPVVPESAYGLEGVGVVIAGTLRGSPVRVQIAAFLDDRYVYAMELQSRAPGAWAEHQVTLIETARSIEPLPRQRRGIEEA